MVNSQCNFCQNLKKSGLNTCVAFPDGIPDEILYNEKSHFISVEGDNGIIFKPKPDVSAEEIKALEFGKIPADVVA